MFRSIGFGVAAVVALLIGSTPAHAAILFADEFDLDPAAAGSSGRTGSDPNVNLAWTESATSGGDIAAGVGEAVFVSDDINAGDFEVFQITRTINATGFSTMLVSLKVREADTMEAGDILRLQVDGGSGFTTIASVSGEFGTATLGPILLAPSFNNTSFGLRVEATSNIEDFFLDRIEITGLPPTQVVYSDAFTLDPGAAGSTDRVGFSSAWTETVGNPPTNGISITADGDEAVFARTTTDDTPDADDFAHITHAFSTVGLENIILQLTARQSATTFENSDRLILEYSIDGVNFTALLTDASQWQGIQDTGQLDAAGNTVATSTGLLLISDPLASNNPNFAVRIRTLFNAIPEQYLLDNFVLRASAIPVIPTPAALPMGLAAMAGLLVRRRRPMR